MSRTTLLLNLHNFAVSQFFNHPASSATYFEGKMLFGTSAGLFESGGDNDGYSDEEGLVPVPISAYVKLPVSEYDYPGYKSLRSVVILGRFDGAISITFEGKGPASEKQYFTASSLAGERGSKVALSTIQRSRYFTAKIANVSGSDFSLDHADVVFIPGPEIRI